MSLTQEQVKEFQDKGMAVIKGFFDPDAMNKMSDLIEVLQNKTPGNSPDAMYFEKSPINGENVLVRIENFMGEQNAELTEVLMTPETVEALEQLLEDKPVLFKDKVNYKFPGCRADKLHQDQAAGWNSHGDYFITLCVVVDDNTFENAPLTFMSSGNYKKALMTPEWTPLREEDPPYPNDPDYSEFPAESGDVIFFDSYIPHGSPANTSDLNRRNIYITFNRAADGDQRAHYYADKWVNYPPNTSEEARSKESFRV